MRKNLPVVEREFPFPSGETLVSTTDLKGRILYGNAAFIAVSGYAKEELLGQPHNLIRHPDMPEEAFRDLWQTIASGAPWSAAVKNRRKDGSYYWVMANVTPLVDNGVPVGYMVDWDDQSIERAYVVAGLVTPDTLDFGSRWRKGDKRLKWRDVDPIVRSEVLAYIATIIEKAK
jgi:PAS domain S-box-containing protein